MADITVNVNHYIHWVPPAPDPRITQILSDTETIKEQLTIMGQTNAQGFAELKTKFADLSAAVVDGLGTIKTALDTLVADKDNQTPESAQAITDLEAGFSDMAAKVAALATEATGDAGGGGPVVQP